MSSRARAGWAKVLWLIVAGVIGLVAGWGLGELGICPVVKRIWTPSWVLFSGGWCFLFLAGFYAVLDLLGVRFWAFPLRVIGMNSIAAYCMKELLEDFIRQSLKIHFGRACFKCWVRSTSASSRSNRLPAAVARPLLDVSPQAVLEDLMRFGGIRRFSHFFRGHDRVDLGDAVVGGPLHVLDSIPTSLENNAVGPWSQPWASGHNECVTREG